MKRTVFITGATSGIGMATAKKLAPNYRLILCGRRQDRLDDIEEELVDVLDILSGYHNPYVIVNESGISMKPINL